MKNPSDEVFSKALRICADKWSTCPEDEWIRIDKDWDLNIVFSNGYRHAYLHPVKDGKTDTGSWISLLEVWLGEDPC
jgi:hypothetical protein